MTVGSPALDLARSEDPDALAAAIEEMTEDEAEALLHDWSFWRRDTQVPPSDTDWLTWLLMGGRGSGKTRPGAETVREKALAGEWGRIALVGATAADVRDVMIEGESGLLAVHARHERPRYEPSKRRLTWPNGALGFAYSAEEPDRLRGPQHHGAWADEIAAWRRGPATWDNLMFGLRLGTNPQVVATTTPRPLAWLRALLDDPTTVVSRMSTYENAANLAAPFLTRILARYEGTRLARQEILGLLVDDVVGALWTALLIEATRVGVQDTAEYAAHLLPDAHDVRVVGVDPAGSALGMTGIVVAGRWSKAFTEGIGMKWDPHKRHADVLDDRSMSGQPEEWVKAVIDAHDYWGCGAVVVERNFGGDMVRAALHAVRDDLRVIEVTASKSKKVRAEPVVNQYDQGRIHHVGLLPDLEEEMTTWVPPGTIDPDTSEDIGSDWSPNRLDAAVWALTHLVPPLAVHRGKSSAPTGGGASRRAPQGSRSTRINRGRG